MIVAAILAAGRSKRMGRSKALLPFVPADVSFVRHIIDTLHAASLHDVIVVGRADDDDLRREIARARPLPRFVENRQADQGQLSSLICAVAAASHPDVAGLLAWPVDMPLVHSDTVAALVRAFESQRPPVARATHGGRRGHPVIFAREVFTDLHTADPTIGAKVVVRRYGERVLDVEVPDEGVLHDIDDPAAYRRHFGRDPR